MTAGHGTPRGRMKLGDLAVDFANSIACPSCQVGDALATDEDLTRWLRSRRALAVGVVHLDDLPTLRRFRSDVRELIRASVMGSRPSSDPLVRVNSVLRLASTRDRLQWRLGRWSIDSGRPPRDPGAVLAGAVALSLAGLLTSSDRQKLKACRGPGCEHFLLARTRQQIWCSPTGCGNRARVARHYRRAKGGKLLPPRRVTSRNRK